MNILGSLPVTISMFHSHSPGWCPRLSVHPHPEGGGEVLRCLFLKLVYKIRCVSTCFTYYTVYVRVCLLNFTPRSTHLFGRTVNDGLLDASGSLLGPAAKAPRDRNSNGGFMAFFWTFWRSLICWLGTFLPVSQGNPNNQVWKHQISLWLFLWNKQGDTSSKYPALYTVQDIDGAVQRPSPDLASCVKYWNKSSVMQIPETGFDGYPATARLSALLSPHATKKHLCPFGSILNTKTVGCGHVCETNQSPKDAFKK